MIGPDPSIVTSLMFHSVGLDEADWIWAKLSEPIATFEHKLKVLNSRGYKTVFWNEVYEHVAGRRRLSHPSVMLTFDDGYLDNWVIVWPILKRYGAKATIFISSDFVEPDGPLRPTLEDVWSGKLERPALRTAGFLRPSEVRAMVTSGLVDVQSHASTHTWLFTTDRLIDVYEPGKYQKYPWMAWNARPDRKPYYMNEDQSSFVSSGEPVFENEKALVARRFTPDAQAVIEFKREWSEGANALNESSGHLARARSIELRLGIDGAWPGKYESDEERLMRIRSELTRSREVLATITGQTPEFLAWPGGAYHDIAVGAARECGFKSYTLGSKDSQWLRNRPGGDPSRLRRIHTNSRLRVCGVFCGMQNGFFQLLLIRAHQKSLVHRMALFMYKTAALLKALLTRVRQ